MKKKNIVYTFISVFSTIFALVGTVVILYLALTSPDSLSNYSTYSYDEYVDRSEDYRVDSDKGAQLYEAESFYLFGDALVKESVGCSNSQEVTGLTKTSAISYVFSSDSSANYKLTTSISYISRNGKSSLANSLFSITFNNEAISMSGVEIFPCYNQQEFIETSLCVLQIKEGRNTFEIVSSSNSDFSFDYFVLTSSKNKTSYPAAIGNTYSQSFSSNRGKQVFEAEEFKQSGALIVNDTEASCSYSSYFTEQGNKLLAYIDSSSQVSTLLTLAIRTPEINSNQVKIKVSLNDKVVFEDEIQGLTSSYQEVAIDYLTLQRDENVISCSSEEGIFYLDYLALDADINYSKDLDNQRYEAEDSDLDSCRKLMSNSASNGYYVGDILAGSVVQYELRSLVNSTSRVAIRIGYRGSETYLSFLLDITFNSASLQLSALKVEKGTSLTAFSEVSLGMINVKAGTNILKITSLSDSITTDCITIYNDEMSLEDPRLVVQGENLVSDSGIKKSFNKYASDNRSAVISGSNSSQFYFQSSVRTSINLSVFISFSEMTDDEDEKNMSVLINGTLIDLSDVSLGKVSTDCQFTLINLGIISVKSGLNVLQIEGPDSAFYLDFMLLTV